MPGIPNSSIVSSRSAAEQEFGDLSVLAFFDVLGFTDRVRILGLKRIADIYREFVSLLDQVKEPNAISFWVPADFDGNVNAQVEKARRGESTRWAPVGASTDRGGIAYFSDTVLMWLPYTPAHGGAAIDLAIDLFCRSMALGLPLRGALSIGDLYMDPQQGIYLGEPIIEAAQAEASQGWCGIGLGPSFKEYPCLVPSDRFLEYEQQIKAGKEDYVLSTALDWTWHWRDRFEPPLEDIAASFRRCSSDPYWAHALAFAKASRHRGSTGLKIYGFGGDEL